MRIPLSPAQYLLLALLAMLLCLADGFASVGFAAPPYFEDGYLGLSQEQLREKLGRPYAVRDRKAALRVFNYYPFDDWEKVFKRLVSPQNGEDVYTYRRDGTTVRYSFSYAADLNDQSDFPTLFVRLVDIEFSPPVPIERVPLLVPEFRPPTNADAPTFRSNLWVLQFKGSPTTDAQLLVRERTKDKLDWMLSFQLFSLQGLPEFLTLKAPIDRVEISAQSLQLVRDRQRATHEPIMNPFSPEFAQRQPPPPPATQRIPVPTYAE
jgi:hypothetical protein